MLQAEQEGKLREQEGLKTPSFRGNSHTKIVYSWYQGGLSLAEMREQGVLDNQQIERAYRRLSSQGFVTAEPLSEPNTTVVFNAIQEGIPRSKISESTGLDRKKVNAAVGQLKKVGARLKRGSDEEVRILRREAALAVKDSIWGDIEEYAILGLTPREIKIAVRIEKDKDFSTSKIDNTVWARKKRVHDERLKRTPEDEIDARKVAYNSLEVIEERVRTLLIVKTLLEKDGISIPFQRSAWQELVKNFTKQLGSAAVLNAIDYNEEELHDSITMLKNRRLLSQPIIDWNDSLYRSWRNTVLHRESKERPGTSSEVLSPEVAVDERTENFTKELIRIGLITENPSYWSKLRLLYKHYNRTLPDSMIEQMRLEAFLAASLHVGVRNIKVYVAYMRAA
jgi:hypothetical protein